MSEESKIMTCIRFANVREETKEKALADLEYLERVEQAAQELAAQETEIEFHRYGLRLLAVLESKPK